MVAPFTCHLVAARRRTGTAPRVTAPYGGRRLARRHGAVRGTAPRGHGAGAGAVTDAAGVSQHVAVRPDGLFNNPAYTQVMKTTGTTTVYVSGQVALDATGATVGAGDLAAQTEQVMANLKIAVEAAGATLADVVKVTTYVVGYQPEHRAVITAARASYFPDGFPASTLIGVQALAAPEWLIEVEAVAVIG